MNIKFQKLILTGFVVCVCTAITLPYNGYSLIGIDDANICMVYMRNLAMGNGFVFNAGGERVEGFSSPVWMFTGALFFALTGKTHPLMLLFNLAAVTFVLWRVILFLDDYFGNKQFLSVHTLLFLGLLSVIPGYFEWCVLSLMETGLWSALLLLLTLNVFQFSLHKQQQRKLSLQFNILLPIIVLSRPEAVLWGPLFILIRFIQVYTHKNNLTEAVKTVLPSVIIFCCTVSAILVFRLWYFGFPLPNTYYAKISDDKLQNLKTGMIYLARFFVNNPVAILTFLASTYTLVKFRKDIQLHNALNRYAYAVCGMALLVPLYTGGDHFGHSRFIQPAVPVIWICLLFTLRQLNIQLRKSWVVATLVVLCFAGQNTFAHYFSVGSGPVTKEWELAIKGRTRSIKMNELFDKLPRFPTQGVLTAGGSAWMYQGTTIDLMGLNNVAMAHADQVKDKTLPKNHASFNKEVFYTLKPDIFLFGARFLPIDSIANHRGVTIRDFSARVFKNIHKDVRFQETYSDVVIIKKGSTEVLATFASNSFLQSIDTSCYTIRRYRQSF